MNDADFEQLRQSLTRGAFLYPPMEPFEPSFRDPAKAMDAVIAKCNALSVGAAHHFDMQKSWLETIRLRADIAFYGSALNCPDKAHDVDVVYFHSRFPPPTRYQPCYVHVFDPMDAAEAHPPGFASSFLAGPLLFPNAPDPSLLIRIEAERRAMQKAPFFNGGIGELLTFSAYKASKKPSDEDRKDPNFPAWLQFRLEFRWCDTANMRMVTHSPHELNEQIREQVKPLKDPEVHALALAAMRRLRVRESEQPALAARFVSELRAKR